ncbi:MAG: response regulator transcription factor [Lachnospiraceae bacterium]|nr:response regulator transcription factor [Lachnospiraceae bacterium]
MHYNCLIVDDEVDLAKMTCEYFEMFDVSCTYMDTAKGCLSFLEKHTVDILLLDINLMEESGFDLCKKIRERWNTPILFISARQSDDDILIALNIGGDDYIKKPYTLSVLLAKVKVILKRMNTTEHYEEVKNESEGEEIRLIEEKLSVVIRNQEISLKAKEFALLKCLFIHRNSIVTKEQLFQEVWGDSFFSDGTLNVHIRKLREKIEENPNKPEIIQTIWGTGYILRDGSENKN